MLFWQMVSNWTSTRQQKHLNIESCQTYGECVFYAVLQLGNTSNSKKLLLNSMTAFAWLLLFMLLFRTATGQFSSCCWGSVPLLPYSSYCILCALKCVIMVAHKRSCYCIRASNVNEWLLRRARSLDVFFVCYVFPQCWWLVSCFRPT